MPEDLEQTLIVPTGTQPVEISSWTPKMVLTVQDAIDQVAERDAFLKGVLREGLDYGVIPGTGAKPTLLKPGAERILSSYGLHPELQDETPPVKDWTGEDHGGEMFFEFTRRCKIWRQTGPGEKDRMLIAQASGSCNSWEKKYRYRWENGKRVANDSVADTVNTILKMADKRALVGATIIAAGWSDLVTQDVEDMELPPTNKAITSPAQATNQSGKYAPMQTCPQCGVAAVIKGSERYGGGFVCWAKKGGCGTKFKSADLSDYQFSEDNAPTLVAGEIDIETKRDALLKSIWKALKSDEAMGAPSPAHYEILCKFGWNSTIKVTNYVSELPTTTLAVLEDALLKSTDIPF